MEFEEVEYTVMEGSCFTPILILSTPDTNGDGTHGSLSVAMPSTSLFVDAMDGLGKSGLSEIWHCIDYYIDPLQPHPLPLL